MRPNPSLNAGVSRMKAWAVLLSLLAAPSFAAPAALSQKTWIHGSEDCKANNDPSIEVFEVDPSTYVLRQNKCVHFEAPFIYVLFGDHTVFVQDTGATSEPDRFPLFTVVGRLVAERQRLTGTTLSILVTHSHSHGDHTAADSQFRGQPSVTLVEPTAEAVRRQLKFEQWPEGQTTLELGGRSLVVFPIPGHQDEHIAVYDTKTGWLLTGDTFYPGHLYVRDWGAYRASIGRLAEFSRSHPVSAILGTHIEISASGELFRAGSTYQPNEAPLPLNVADLLELNERLREAGDKPAPIRMPMFEVVPIGMIQRILGSILKSLGLR
jgi:hydroxyacylglutathione hydrolase